jgi:tetratricopeptide (TPR) repeat protein
VFEKDPTFLHAERRRCGELLQLGRRDEALKLCRDAVDKDPSAPNLSALASALVSKNAGEKPWESETDEAKQLLERAQALDPDDSYIVLTQCQLAVTREHLGDLRDCVDFQESRASRARGHAVRLSAIGGVRRPPPGFAQRLAFRGLAVESAARSCVFLRPSLKTRGIDQGGLGRSR